MKAQPRDKRQPKAASVGLSVVLLGSALIFLSRGSGSGAALQPCPPPPRAWEFLDASSQIEHPTTHNGFRAAMEADLDNDGDLDVVLVQNVTSEGVVGSPAQSVLYMNDNGRFVDRTAQYLPELLVPQVTWWVNVHDFDVPPDGLRDVFVPGGQGEPSRLYRNRGFGPGSEFLGFEDVSWRIEGPLATSTHSYHSHKGDFDGDGAMDVLVYQFRPDLGAAQGQNRLLMNRGGILTDETDERLPIRSEPGIFGHAEDLNGDGKIDISQVNLKTGLVPGVPSSVPSIRVLINDGTGHFPLDLEQPMPERINPLSGFGTYSLDHADVNGDGRLDIYVINWGAPANDARDAILVNSGDPAQLFKPQDIYIPEFPLLSRDSDGDHPVARDLNGDGKPEIVVAQFAARSFVLINETCNGVRRMVERTPSEVPSGDGFRVKIFDANGDGKDDVWFALRLRNHLMIGNNPEQEPNGSIPEANPTTTFPALRTGAGAEGDQDVFGLPTRAVAEGAGIFLRPAVDSDLRLLLLDASGGVLAVSEVPGPGATEQIGIGPGSVGAYVRAERQADGGSGLYRLEVVPGGVPAPPPADSQAPTTAITAPQNGATVSATFTITASANDNVGVSRVEFYIDGVLRSTDTTAPYSYAWNTTTFANGTHSIFSRAFDAAGNVGTSAAVNIDVNNQTAIFDSVLRAPKCGIVAGLCDSGALLNGRDGIGPEPNQPNTIKRTCIDRTVGSYHVDESNDRIRVFANNGSSFAAGTAVTVQATVWAWTTPSEDKLELYSAANANNPLWKLIATLTPAAAGAQTLSATYTLPAGTLQAVRARFHYQGAAGRCGTGDYDDHDDLIFAVR